VKKARHAPDFILFIIILLLLTIGIVMVYSSSYVTAQVNYADGAHFFKRQLIWSVLGIIGMLVIMKIDYRIYSKWAYHLFGLSVLLLILLFVPGVGITIKDATRWIGIEALSLTFQPSEIAKLGVVIFLAKFLAERTNQIKQFFKGLIPPLLVVGCVCLLILKQPDLGTAFTIAVTAFILLLAAGARFSHLGVFGVLGGVLVALAIKMEPYRMKRITAFLDPWADPLQDGFQTVQSLLAVGSGRIFGTGLGHGRQKFLYLPEQQTDFIFAVLAEELGFIGASFVILLFFAFAWRGLKIAIKAPDLFGALLATGITTMVVVQAAINIGVVTGCLPVTGITLPFISYGGSSLTLNLLGIGILLNISRYVKE
jgi:cell division protein FtsW